MRPAKALPAMSTPRINSVMFAVLWIGSVATVVWWHARFASTGWYWTTADWLINFEGGLIRRGLMGEVLLNLFADEFNVAYLVFLLQVLLLLTVYVSAAYLFFGSSRSSSWFMLAMSPAFLLFFPLSPEGSLRKEVFAVAAAALLAVAIRRRSGTVLVWIATAVFVVGALAHESVALAVPALLYLIHLSEQRSIIGKRTAIAASTALALSAAISIVMAIAQPGTPAQASKVCERVLAATGNPVICQGSIEALGLGLRNSVATVSALLPGNVGYLALIVLSLVPFALLGANREFWRLVLVVYAFLMPLFFVAWDYGRWIFLATAILSFIAFVRLNDHRNEIHVPAFFAYAYVFLWFLPTLSFGYSSLLSRVIELIYTPAATWIATFL